MRKNKSKKPSKEVIEKAILASYGNILKAAKSLKCERATLYKWIEEESLQDVVQDGRDAVLDIAENSLLENIKEGRETSLIFFLKTQGRKRGYSQNEPKEDTTPIINFVNGEELP